MNRLMMKIVKMNWFGLGMTLLFGVCTMYSQSQDLMEIIDLDPDIKHSRLPNGFNYYIKHLSLSQKKLEIRLYVKAGNQNEVPGQVDFAHAIEHLAFKSAKDFPINLLDDPLLRTRLGLDHHDIFGRTSAMFTWYYFNIPNMNAEALDTAFLWFQNISDLDLNPNIINKEKGPLRQELIFRQGNDLDGFFTRSKIESSLFPCKQDYSHFFEANKNFNSKALIDFYKKWYRPDRMSLIITGDTTKIKNIEGRIKSYFSNLKSQEEALEITDCIKEYLERPNQFFTLQRQAKNSGSNTQNVNILFYMRDKNIVELQGTWNGLKREVIWSILEKLINQRLMELGSGYGSFYSAYILPPNVVTPATSMEITATLGIEKPAVEETVKIILQAKEFGFSQKEWQQAKDWRLETLDSSASNSTEYWMEQLENHIANGSAIPNKKDIKLQHWLRELSLDDFNTLAKKHLSVIPNDIGLIAPSRKNTPVFSESQIRKWINEIVSEGVKPYMEPEVSESLLSETELAKLPANGFTHKRVDMTGVQELILDNGVKVILQNSKPSSDWDKDKITIHGFSPYGASCFPKEDYFSAINAPRIVLNAGVGKMDKFELNLFLKNTSLWQGIKPYVHYKESGIKGTASKEDLETLFQLVYLYSAQPRNDTWAFEDWKSAEERRYYNPNSGIIQEDFDVLIRKSIGDYSKIPRGTIGYNGIKKTNMQRAYNIYGQLLGNSADYTFIISGDFSSDIVKQLVQKYLGNLPKNLKVSSCNSIKSEEIIPKGPVYIKFNSHDLDASYEMKSVKYSLNYNSKANSVKDWKEQIKMDILGYLMNSKIKELRFKEDAALYNVFSITQFNRETLNYSFQIHLDCIPEELEVLRKICKDFVADLKKGRFKEERFNDVIQNRILPKYRTQNQSQYKQLLKIYNHYRFNEPWVTTHEMEQYINTLDLKDIQNTAKKHLNDINMFEFVFKDDRSSP